MTTTAAPTIAQDVIARRLAIAMRDLRNEKARSEAAWAALEEFDARFPSDDAGRAPLLHLAMVAERVYWWAAMTVDEIQRDAESARGDGHAYRRSRSSRS